MALIHVKYTFQVARKTVQLLFNLGISSSLNHRFLVRSNTKIWSVGGKAFCQNIPHREQTSKEHSAIIVALGRCFRSKFLFHLCVPDCILQGQNGCYSSEDKTISKKEVKFLCFKVTVPQQQLPIDLAK